MNVKVLRGLLGLGLALTGMASGAGTIVGSAHDFSAKGWAPNAQICVACHAPHNASTTVTDAPLWSHTSSTATYTVYANPANGGTLNAVTGQPGSISKLCLSCHDGTVAVNSFVGATGASVNATKLVGVDLKDDHPIGFTYDAKLASDDGALEPITKSVTIGSGSKTKLGTIESNMLYGGKMECASCHDVHNTFTAAGSGLIKVSMGASALCTTCHAK
jgi:predicted CXXCH cytochrome family protein